jgi:hypothetical protein
MNVNYRTDAEHSGLKPAGPHLIEKSSDSPTQMVVRGKITVRKSYTATVATTIQTIHLKPRGSRDS